LDEKFRLSIVEESRQAHKNTRYRYSTYTTKAKQKAKAGK